MYLFENFVENQARVVKMLRGIAKNKQIANAYLFSGETNLHKDIAIAFAKLLNCENNQEIDGCGYCNACQKIDRDICPDLIFLTKEKNQILIEQISDLSQRVKFGPSHHKWLFCFIDEADKLTPDASNRFLKLLEEPPQKTTFILSSFSETAILKTIFSRCQNLKFSQNLERNDYNFDFDILKLDFVDFSKIADELSKEKDLVKDYLNYLILTFKQNNDFISVNKVLEYLEKLNYNLRLNLFLEALYLDLRLK